MTKSMGGQFCELTGRDNDRTAPGTPPPPYFATINGTKVAEESVTDHCQMSIGSPTMSTSSVPIQKPIISMEDDDGSDQESFLEEQGPFRSLQQLLEPENSVYLTVFLNYVLSNSDPAPLLFYLITRIYRDGTAKDMRKWSYEIHSTFLVPRAPLLLPNVDENLAHEVDGVLQKEFDKCEILRKIFWKSRNKAKEVINGQLQDFQVKRTAGLGTMYGPSDQQLQDSKGDKAKEQKIVEETLLPKLQLIIDEVERESPNECPKKQALSSALSTVLHRIFVTRAMQSNALDKVHHFVSREKSFKSRLMGKNRKVLVEMFLIYYLSILITVSHFRNKCWAIRWYCVSITK